MTGIVGGTATGPALRDQLDELRSEPWYEQERLEAAPFGAGLVTHGARDPDGTTALQDGSRFLAIYGVVTNLDDLGWSEREVCERVLADPTATLTALDGPFVLVAADGADGRIVLGTDKLGTRRCYVINSEGFAFGTSLAPLLARAPDPTVDERGLTDMLTIGQVWGGRTLVEEVESVPPGTAVVYDADDGTLIRDQYWEHTFDDSVVPSTAALAAEYRRAVGEMAGTVDPDRRIGVWLSGGLDSRTLAAALSRHHRPETYTYDANPPTGANLELAARVAGTLGLPNERVTLAPDEFCDVIDDGVRIVDGMVPWTTFLNLSASFWVADGPDVMLEGSGQGGLLGNDVWRSDLERARSPADALYRSHHFVDRETSADLLTLDVDPMRTYTEETNDGTATGFDERVLRAYRRNFYPYGEFASNAVARSQAGTRVPVADGDFLRLTGRIPRESRTGSVPFTRGSVPYGTAKYKLGLAREMDRGLDRIPYERTGVPPARPLWHHAAGFVVSTALDRLRGETTYGGGTLAGEWYRSHDGLREWTNARLDEVCDRSWVDDGVVRDLQYRHLDGDGDHSNPISCLTTVERWLQTTLD
jgi:asparagine synthase (glutamine-hydrolysing)